MDVLHHRGVHRLAERDRDPAGNALYADDIGGMASALLREIHRCVTARDLPCRGCHREFDRHEAGIGCAGVDRNGDGLGGFARGERDGLSDGVNWFPDEPVAYVALKSTVTVPLASLRPYGLVRTSVTSSWLDCWLMYALVTWISTF